MATYEAALSKLDTFVLQWGGGIAPHDDGVGAFVADEWVASAATLQALAEPVWQWCIQHWSKRLPDPLAQAHQHVTHSAHRRVGGYNARD